MLSIICIFLFQNFNINKSSNISDKQKNQIKDQVYEGSCGPNATFTFQDGILTISGSGDMENYTSDNIPWQNPNISHIIKNVIIDDGISICVKDVQFSNAYSFISVKDKGSIT